MLGPEEKKTGLIVFFVFLNPIWSVVENVGPLGDKWLIIFDRHPIGGVTPASGWNFNS